MSPTLRGALWMGGAILSFCAMAIAVRELQRHIGAFEILFLRSLVMLAIVAALLPGSGGGAWRTRHLGLHVSRSLVHLAGQYLWVYCIGLLALATVFAVEFTMPVWVAILAALFLGERLNRGRLVQLALGLAGVMIILRPGAGAVPPAALLMVLCSLCYGATMIFTKRLSATDSPHAVLFWMSLIQTPLTLAAALPQWVTPPASSLPWIGVIGAGSYFAHYCMTRSMKLVDATLAVPIDFIRLPLIAVLGAALYGEPLDPLVFVGAAIIFCGTYYSIRRESRASISAAGTGLLNR
jgi:drug/metabolite transporter (DMT)-like permease